MFPAALLAEAEKLFCCNQSAGDYFDLIAGTSTGGIIALALSAGISASEVLELYISKGRDIFPPANNPIAALQKAYRNRVRRLWHYHYEREPLKHGLEQLFGTKRIGDLNRRLCIPAFDGNFNEVHVFKTPHHPDFRIDWREFVVDVGLATAAAPAFFPVFEQGGRLFADGGVWANNPIMLAVVDALTCFELRRRSIEVLSIGCGAKDLRLTSGQLARGGLWQWRRIMEVAIELQTQGADGQARALVGTDHVTRIIPDREARDIDLDDYLKALNLLPANAKQAIDSHTQALSVFFQHAIDPYEPFFGSRAPHA